MEIAFERMERLNISDGRTQPIGAYSLLDDPSRMYEVKKITSVRTKRVRKVNIVDINKGDSCPAG